MAKLHERFKMTFGLNLVMRFTHNFHVAFLVLASPYDRGLLNASNLDLRFSAASVANLIKPL